MPEYFNHLDAKALEARGVTGWPYGFEDQVRFHELDALNHVNNVAFLMWFETIRVRYIQDYGLTRYRDSDPQIVVRHQTADYLHPMFQDERYIVAVRCRLLKTSSLVLDYAVFSDAVMRASGSSVLVSLERDGKTRRAHNADAIRRITSIDAPERA